MDSDPSSSPLVRQTGVIVQPQTSRTHPASFGVEQSHRKSQSHPHLVFSRHTTNQQQSSPSVSNNTRPAHQDDARNYASRNPPTQVLPSNRSPPNRSPQVGILQQVLQKTPYRPMVLDMTSHKSSPSMLSFPKLPVVYRTSRPFSEGLRQMHSTLRTALNQSPSRSPQANAAPSAAMNKAAMRPLRFPPPVISTAAPRGTRSLSTSTIRNHAQSTASLTDSGNNSSDSLAKISELAEISRASIPMPPLEDDDISVISSRENFRPNSISLDLHKTPSQRDLMPPPPSPGSNSRTSSPSPKKEDKWSPKVTTRLTFETDNLGVHVDIVKSLDPMPFSVIDSKSIILRDSNLGFDDFASAIAYLSLKEPPLNPLEFENSKDVLLSVFGPNMTLYRCGGCESTFVFRNIFIDHFYRGNIPFYLDCDHCQKRHGFFNICQVKDHVRSHGPDIEVGKGFCLTIGDDIDTPPYSYNPLLSETNTSGHSRGKSSSIESSFQPKSTSEEAAQFTQNTGCVTSPLETLRQYSEKKHMQSLKDASEKKSELQKLSQALTTSSTAQLYQQEKTSQQQSVSRNQQQSTPGRHGPTITVNQILEREFAASKAPSRISVNSAANCSKDVAGIPCAFCPARFENQIGVTHHFQRCRDVAKAAQEFRCVKCDVVCCNACSFEAHRRLHNLRLNPSMIDVCCPECGLRMKNPGEVEQHVGRRCVHFSRMLCCSYACCVINCRYHVTSETEYLSHVANEHGGPAAERGICPVCKANMVGPRSELVRHLTANPPCRQRIMQQKSHFFAYRCNYCDEQQAPLYETKAAMRDHILVAHSDSNVSTQVTPRISPEPNQNIRSNSGSVQHEAQDMDHTKGYCLLCRDQFPTSNFARHLDALEAHVFKIHVPGKYPMNCVHCQMTVTSAQELFGHLVAQVFKLPFRKCDRCQFVTLSSTGLVSHNLVFHQQRQLHPYVCAVCQKVGYNTAAELRSHLMTLHGIPEESFKLSDVSHHISPINRPASAESSAITQKSSSKRPAEEDPAKLTKQMRSQRSSSSNFACCLCDFECGSSAMFAEHVQVQHGTELSEVTEMRLSKAPGFAKYHCKVCEDQKSSFICDSQHIFHEHVRQSHPSKETSYQCGECALQLLSLSVLQMHLRVVHGILDPNAFLATSSFYTRVKFPNKNPSTSASGSSSSPVPDSKRNESPTGSRSSVHGLEKLVENGTFRNAPALFRPGSHTSVT